MARCHRPGATQPEDVMVAPSLLSADFAHLADELASVSTADLVHYDVMDGHFVPPITFGADILRAVKASCDLPVDVHLMVSDPEGQVPLFLDAGADIVSFHLEATPHAHRLVGLIRDRGAKAAVAVNPATPAEALDAILDDLDMVLVMTVNPGYGGQAFIPTMKRKVRQIRRMCDERGVSPLIEVDGGIGPATAGAVTAAGATVLVAGSAVFGKGDRAAAIAELRAAAQRGRAQEGGRP